MKTSRLAHTTTSSQDRCIGPNLLIIKQVALNKSRLSLKIQMQNQQTLQLFTRIIKTESIYKIYLKCQAESLGSEIECLIIMGDKA